MATLAKTLLPLVIMTLIMLASLYFPNVLVKEKITVVITAAFSGAVLLAAVNSQLGAVGYTMAVEYVFYIFFALRLLCIVSVPASERLRRRPCSGCRQNRGADPRGVPGNYGRDRRGCMDSDCSVVVDYRGLTLSRRPGLRRSSLGGRP
jgi:hypothetical protein